MGKTKKHCVFYDPARYDEYAENCRRDCNVNDSNRARTEEAKSIKHWKTECFRLKWVKELEKKLIYRQNGDKNGRGVTPTNNKHK